MRIIEPVVGHWYHNVTDDQDFEVVLFETDADTVEIQTAEGDVEEFDLESWYELELEEIEAPEDWSGPCETESTAVAYGTDSSLPEKWSSPFSHAERDD